MLTSYERAVRERQDIPNAIELMIQHGGRLALSEVPSTRCTVPRARVEATCCILEAANIREMAQQRAHGLLGCLEIPELDDGILPTCRDESCARKPVSCELSKGAAGHARLDPSSALTTALTKPSW